MKQITYVALLRGINIGGKNTMSMGPLKVCFEELGFLNVKTYINSGNAIFTDTRDKKVLVPLIESCITKHFKLQVRVTLRTKKEIDAVCKKLPHHWTNDEHMRTDVLFLWDEVDHRKVTDEIVINPEVDNLVYVKGAVIWNIERQHVGKSKLHKFIGTKLYKHMTARNANTTRKLKELMS